jgi:uncharacterized protein YndB with AHSA1/START domain
MAAEYVFVDEWDVTALPEQVFEALADARTYPEWWTPTYLEVSADGPPKVGRASRQRFRGKLPYTLSTVSTIVALEPPKSIRGPGHRRPARTRRLDAHAPGRRHARPV